MASEPKPAAKRARVTGSDDAQMTELDIVLCFDTTASMTPVLFQVRRELARLTRLLFETLPGQGVSVRLGVIAHGDYDSAAQYVTKHVDLSDSVDDLTQFINTVEPVHNGWNEGEAYEQALRVAKGLSWRPSSRKVLVMSGDDKPHPAFFPANADKVDWEKESDDLAAMDIPIYAVQCPSLSIPRSEAFYKTLAAKHSRGAYIMLSQFALVNELIVALLYHATDDRSALEQHEDDLIAAGRYNRNMELAFNTLLQRDDERRAAMAPAASSGSGTGTGTGASRVPVPAGRFQRFTIDENSSIKQFVETTGAVFKAGRGFFELSKAESVSQKKEVILEHIASGEMFSGSDAREMVGLPETGTKRINPGAVPAGYRAFIQSTSYNRKLIGGTSFLYEVTQA